MATDCIFCKIAAGDVPAKSVYRDGDVVAIEDLNPQAPHHVLVMPIRHYATIGELVGAGDGTLLSKLMEIAAAVGQERGGEDGYRLVINTEQYGGQTVDHVHVHVLAGRPMTWPPG